MRYSLRSLLPLLLALVSGAASAPAIAQNGQQVFDFFANQLDQGIARQQQRQIQRQQQLQHDQNYQIFLAAWNDCFNTNDLARCDFALTYPSMLPDDQQRLLLKRAEIAAAIQAQEEATRREQAERAAQDRQRRIEAAQEARRVQQEREQESARLRQELARQRSEARAVEQKRLAEMRSLRTALRGCQRFDPASCDRALASEHADPTKLDTLREWRSIGLNFANDRTACQAGAVDACDRALASRAVADADRPQLNAWRAAASPVDRAIAALSAFGSTTLVFAQALPTMIQDLPLSTQITGAVATVLALALAAILYRRAPTSPAPAAMPEVPASKWNVRAQANPPRGQQLWLWLQQMYLRFRRAFRSNPTASPTTSRPPPAASPSTPAPLVSAVHDRPRDTETAIDAMQLVLAYTAEFKDNIGDALTDPAYAAKVLNTLSLISRQLDIAERADATATLNVEDDNGDHVAYTIASLKAGAIFYEAMCRMADDPKRSIRLFEQVLQLTPDAAHAYFWIGMLNADMLNKTAAVAAFEKAVALDPRDMDYRKELLRAQSISASQVAYDRAASGVRTTITAAKLMWYGFWIIAIIMFAAAVSRGDNYTAGGVLLLFAVFAFVKQSIVWLKNWFTETF